MKKVGLLVAGLVSLQSVFAGTFTSNASAAWNLASTWSFTGDADGIPDSDDDVTVQAAHTVSVSGTTNQCRNLVVNGVLNLNSSCNVKIYGNYTLNGSETGINGSLSFWGATGTIAGSGTFGTQVRVSFINGNYTINSEVNFLKSIVCNTGNGIITNNGYVRFDKIYGPAAGTWINATGSTLELASYLVSGWDATLNFTAVNNTVHYSNSSGSVTTKTPMGGTYYHLKISGSGSSKRLASNIQINGNLIFGTNGILDSEGYDINLAGNFVKPLFSGVIIQDPGTVVTFNGTSPQSINSTGAHPFNHIAFDNPTTVTFNTGTSNINNSFSVLQGTVNVGTNKVTLVSNATTTAIIGPSNGSITGTLVMQRFVSGRTAGYSDMAGSVVGQTLADWDDELLLVYDYNPPTAYPSVFGYDEVSFDYIPITAATQPLDPGIGYEVYLDSDGSQTTFNNTTILDEGIPTIGDVDLSSIVTNVNDGWNLVGNPYHANLSWDALHATTTDISTDIMFYDENIEDFTTTSTGSGELIAPNQGFWINVTGGAPSFTFTEAIKSTSNSSNFRHVKQNMFGVRLKNIGQTRFTSGTSFRFSTSPASEIKASLPFKKVPHPHAPALASVKNGKPLKINLLDANENTVTVPLSFHVGVDGIYTLEAENIFSAETEGYTCITLIDNQTNESIDLKNENYQFSATVNDAETRFTLVLSKSGDCQKSAQTPFTASNNVNITRVGDFTVVGFDFENETTASIRIVDLLGQNLVPTQTVNATTNQISISMPANYHGIYLVDVMFNNQTVSRKLFK